MRRKLQPVDPIVPQSNARSVAARLFRVFHRRRSTPVPAPASGLSDLDRRVMAAGSERERLEILLGPELSKLLVMREILPDGTRGEWVPLPPKEEA